MPKRYWLMKCEPSAYTIEDLERDGTTGWEGVRNYQVRNFLRDDLQVGDAVLFYASNASAGAEEKGPEIFSLTGTPPHKRRRSPWRRSFSTAFCATRSLTRSLRMSAK